MRMEPTDSSETSTINVTWTPEMYPKDNKLRSDHVTPKNFCQLANLHVVKTQKFLICTAGQIIHVCKRRHAEMKQKWLNLLWPAKYVKNTPQIERVMFDCRWPWKWNKVRTKSGILMFVRLCLLLCFSFQYQRQDTFWSSLGNVSFSRRTMFHGVSEPLFVRTVPTSISIGTGDGWYFHGG